jgi:hypothetical protein
MDGGRARFRLAAYAVDADGVGAVTEDADDRLEARLARRSSFSRWFSVARMAAATTGSCDRVAVDSGIALSERTVVAGVVVVRESDEVEDDAEVPKDDREDRLLEYGNTIGIVDSVPGRAPFVEER